MGCKHTVNHKVRFGRGKSNYPARLARRGLSKTPRMESLETLRTRQARRVEQTGGPWKVWDEPGERVAA
jgi:hypothetical protein